MASSDFDDIFGDLKEDQQFSASLTTTDLDDDSIFGDAPVKATITTSPPPAAATTTAPAQDQDEFLSWLDDGPPAPAPATPAVPPPPPVSKAPTPPKPVAMSTISLGDDDDDDFLSTMAPTTSNSSSSSRHSSTSSLPSPMAGAVNPMPPAVLQVHVTTVSTQPPPISTITLDDDDDDDLDKIIEQAKANARKSGGSRESSNSSLQIKSQSHRTGSAQFDTATFTKQYLATGVISTPAARVAMWEHALARYNSSDAASISMYAVQTTPLDLPNQQALRKDVEAMCTAIFSSKLHAETLNSSTSSSHSDSVDASRLLFIDNAEILVTYLCKKLHLAEYPPGFAFVFGPALAASGNDPLRMDLIATMHAACQRVMPHLARQIAPQTVAEARRSLLKLLLLYHAPAIAFHLDQHFHQWHSDDATIPDAWLASLFESDGYRDGFEYLIKIWDCCLLLAVEDQQLQATHAFPSITACFIVVHLIARAEKKLLKMEGDQLRHCMAQTLREALQDKSDPLVTGVTALVHATPPSLCIKLRDAGLLPSSTPSSPTAAQPDTTATKDNKAMAFLTASTNGVKQVGSLMLIDMPTKLLTTVVPIKFPSSSAGAGAKDHSANEEFFTQLMRESTPSSSVCVTLIAGDVIPHVFRSFQAPQSDATRRYFIIDCRASDETKQGQIPTAFHFDPDAVTNPSVLDTVLATLTPLKSSVHFCVMGHGYGQIADDLRQFLASSSATSSSLNELPFFLKDDFLESFARDISRVNAAVLFLAKRGFPHVSVMEGGYAAAHNTLARTSQEGFSVADLIDHNAPQCSLCQHRRKASFSGTASGQDESQSRTGSSRGSSAASLPTPRLISSGSGELDAKALFDGHSSPSGTGSSYFSSFAGALKTGSKAMGMMNPTAVPGTKWLMGKKPTGSTPNSPVPATATTDTGSPVAKSSSSGLPNFGKLKSSLSHLGSESLDMLKKAEPVGLKGMFSASSSSNLLKSTGQTASVASPSSSSLPRTSSFQRADEDVFSIDDDDEEEQDDFVGSTGGRGSSRSSSSSSLGHRTDSFTNGSSASDSTVALHTVEQGQIHLLTKGMRVSRTQMLPFMASTFFSAYKKKVPTNATARASMLPRRLVVAENHVIVLKAERNMDDVYCVKSCHALGHLARMTCLKKNALMVTMYYKWKAPHSGEVLEKKNAYEVQQRDEFIKVVKTAMEKM